jgi:hypothetical protein
MVIVIYENALSGHHAQRNNFAGWIVNNFRQSCDYFMSLNFWLAENWEGHWRSLNKQFYAAVQCLISA